MIVIIRDIEAATNNANSLIASGIDAIPLAVLSHTPIELDPNVLNVSYQAIIFTSKYGILNYDSFFNLPAWCVGDITAKVAKNIGYTKSLQDRLFSCTNFLDQLYFLDLRSLKLGYLPVIMIYSVYYATNVLYKYILQRYK